MNWLRARFHAFFENPLVRVQLDSVLNGPRFAIVFSILNLALLITFGCILAAQWGRGGRSLQVGEWLYLGYLVTVYMTFAVFLPIRVAGHLEGPRVGQVFDQIVVTGMSPLRLHFGSWALGLAFAAVILLASLPFAGLASLFGAVSFTRYFADCSILLLYANVIIGVTLGLGVFEREWAIVPLAILAFVLFGSLGFSPLPGCIAEATPVRYFAARTLTASYMMGDPVWFLSQPAPGAYRLALWSTILLPFFALVVLGPVNRFEPGWNVFGTVNLPGKRKDNRVMRRLRQALTRRVELAFFYENRHPWFTRHEFLIRSAVLIIPLVFVWGIVIGVTYGPVAQIAKFSRDYHFLSAVIANGIFTLIWVFATTESRRHVLWKERFFGREVPRERLIAARFLVVLGVLLLIHFMIFQSASSGGAPNVKGFSLANYSKQWWGFMAILMISLLNVFLVARLLSTVAQTIAGARGGLVALGILFALMPVLVEEAVQAQVFPDFVRPIKNLSPIMLFINAERSDPQLTLGLWQLGTTAGLFVLLRWARQRALRRSMAYTIRTTSTIAATILLFGLCVAPTSQTVAQNVGFGQRFDIEVRSAQRGFDGRVFAAHVDFYTVVLRNRTSAEVSGTLLINDGNDGTLPFVVGPTTTKTLRWSRTADPEALGRAHSATELSMRTSRGTREIRKFSATISKPRQVKTVTPGLVRNQGTFMFASPGASAPRIWRENLLADQVLELAGVTPESLPLEPQDYTGVDALFVDLSSLVLTKQQRQALITWVKLGGTVIFFGDAATIAQDSAGWQGLLGVEGRENAAHDGGDFTVATLRDGEVVWKYETAGGETVPILSLASWGPGTVGWLSFDPTRARLPAKLQNNRDFWRRLSQLLPWSNFPVLPFTQRHENQHLRDGFSSQVTIGYFLIYSLLIGPVVGILFRRRERRRKMWLFLAVVPAAFTLGIPLLSQLLATQRSYAEQREILYFGSWSDRAIGFGQVRVCSSGRRDHAVELTGATQAFELSHRRSHYDNSVPKIAFSPLKISTAEAREQGGPPDEKVTGEVSMTTLPWGTRQFVYMGETEARRPVRGRATVTITALSGTAVGGNNLKRGDSQKRPRRRGRKAQPQWEATLNAELSPLPSNAIRPTLLVMNWPYSKPVIALRISSQPGEPVRKSCALATQSRYGDNTIHVDRGRSWAGLPGPANGARVAFSPSGQVRVLLAYQVKEPLGWSDLQSPDLLFEREISTATGAKLRDFWQEPGQYKKTFRARWIVVEVPLIIE